MSLIQRFHCFSSLNLPNVQVSYQYRAHSVTMEAKPGCPRRNGKILKISLTPQTHVRPISIDPVTFQCSWCAMHPNVLQLVFQISVWTRQPTLATTAELLAFSLEFRRHVTVTLFLSKRHHFSPISRQKGVTVGPRRNQRRSEQQLYSATLLFSKQHIGTGRSHYNMSL